MWVQSLGQEDPLEQEMATHSSILAWRMPWTEEPGSLHTVHGVATSWTEHTHALCEYVWHKEMGPGSSAIQRQNTVIWKGRYKTAREEHGIPLHCSWALIHRYCVFSMSSTQGNVFIPGPDFKLAYSSCRQSNCSSNWLSILCSSSKLYRVTVGTKTHIGLYSSPHGSDLQLFVLLLPLHYTSLPSHFVTFSMFVVSVLQAAGSQLLLIWCVSPGGEVGQETCALSP